MKIAVVVDWLVVYSGAERVLEQILEIYPDADIFALVDFLEDHERGFLKGKKATTTFIQKLPFARKKYRSYLPVMPLAIEQLDVSGYDLVISCSHAVAKGVLTGPDQVHICYTFSPIRYAWDMQNQYLKESGLDKGLKGWLARLTLHRIRNFDVRSSLAVDHFVASSEYIGRRIRKYYRREPSRTIYPPVSVDDFTLEREKQDYYVTTSRMVPYKRMDLIAGTFARMPDKKLVIIGDGPEMEKVRDKARGADNITVTGYLPFPEMKQYLQQARGFVFAAEEDFGIAPVEAMACGTPVIAFGKGGALETVVEGETGVFFREQTVESITAAIEAFEEKRQSLTPEKCRARAEEFSNGVFREHFVNAVDTALASFPSPPTPLPRAGEGS